MCILPAVAIQSLLLCVATIVWRWTHRGFARFLTLSSGATLLAYGLAGILVVQAEREYARLRALYPYESMEARLPRPRTTPEDSPPLPAAALRLSRLEERLPERAVGFKAYQLEKLHEHIVDLFVNSPGFGVARMSYPSEWSLAATFRPRVVPPQPGSHFGTIWSPGAHERLPADAEAPLGDLLEESILDFVNEPGFGYFKDRHHVSGFLPHEFSRTPSPAKNWELQTLELVSLLLHDEPEVYVASHLLLDEQVAQRSNPSRGRIRVLCPDPVAHRRGCVHKSGPRGRADAGRNTRHKAVRRLPCLRTRGSTGGIFVYFGFQRRVEMMEPTATSDKLIQALHEAGWSTGGTSLLGKEGVCWVVYGIKGHHTVHAQAKTHEEAWKQAYRKAEELGLVPRSPDQADRQERL